MARLPQTITLVVEDEGSITLAEAVIRHLGCEPGVEARVACDVGPDGSIFIQGRSNADADRNRPPAAPRPSLTQARPRLSA